MENTHLVFYPEASEFSVKILTNLKKWASALPDV